MSLGMLIAVMVLIAVFLVLINLVQKSTPNGIDKEHFRNEWKDVIVLAKEPKTRPMSIVHGDKLLDEALKCSGYKGDTMAERLVSAKKVLKHKDSVWTAHKVRNKIVHETTFEPSEKQAKQALAAYNSAFKDLGVW